MATYLSTSLKRLCAIGFLALFPTVAFGQIGCEVVRDGGYNTFSIGAPSSAHFIWAYLLSNNCLWPQNGENEWIHITAPAGTGHCYDSKIDVNVENRTYNKSFIISLMLVHEGDAPGGWITDVMGTVTIAPRGQTGSNVQVVLDNPVPFEGLAGSYTRVKGYWTVIAADPDFPLSLRVHYNEFRVWEVDCGGA